MTMKTTIPRRIGAAALLCILSLGGGANLRASGNCVDDIDLRSASLDGSQPAWPGDNGCGSPLQRVRYEIVAVLVLAAQGDKAASLLRLAGVDDEKGDLPRRQVW